MAYRRPTTQLRTRRALLILDCQNAFLAPTLSDNKTPNPMVIPPSRVTQVVKNIDPVLSAFREGGDEVIWVTTEFAGNRESGRRDGVFVNEEDEEDEIEEEEEEEVVAPVEDKKPVGDKKKIEEKKKVEAKKEEKPSTKDKRKSGSANGANGANGAGNHDTKNSSSSQTTTPSSSTSSSPIKFRGKVAAKYQDLLANILNDFDSEAEDTAKEDGAPSPSPPTDKDKPKDVKEDKLETKEEKKEEKKEKPRSKTDEYLSEDFTDEYPDFWSGEKYKLLPDNIKSLMNESKDKRFTKSEYSAFKIANFLGILRSRMITEIYFAGVHSNVGVFASVADAAMHGFVMTVVEDCVLYRSESRHQTAMSEMEKDLGMVKMSSRDLLKKMGKFDGKQTAKDSPESKGEEVSGTGRIRNPTMDPQVVEALMEKLKVGSTTEEDEDEEKDKRRNSASIPTQKLPTNGIGNRPIANSVSRRLPQRDSLKTPEQLIGSSKASERPKSAPVSGFQPPPESSSSSASSSPTKAPENSSSQRLPVAQRPYSMDASKLEEDEEIVVQDFKRNVRPRTSGPSVSSGTPNSSPAGPRERVRSKVTMRRPTEKKPRPGSPDKPGSSSAVMTKSGDIARAMSTLSISTISSGEAEKSQAAKEELLKSILGKKADPQPDPTGSSKGKEVESESPNAKLDSKTDLKTDPKTDSSTDAKIDAKSDAPQGPASELKSESKSESKSEPATDSEKSGEGAGITSEPVKDQEAKDVTVTPEAHDDVKEPSIKQNLPEATPESTTTEAASKSLDTILRTESEPIASAAEMAPANTSSVSKTQDSNDAEKPSTEPPTIKEEPQSTKEPTSGTPKTSPPPPSTQSARKQRRKEAPQTLGPNDTLGEPTDSTSLITSFLPADLSPNAFNLLKSEVQWRVMYHRGGEVPRLVAVQGTIDDDGSFPIYRHPSDESPPLLPFSKTVEEIRKHVEKKLGHPVNHVLIQLYRAGTDYISEHSDKTLDIVKGSNIVNVSLGAQRVMTLRTKKKELDEKPATPVAEPTEATTTPNTNKKEEPEERIVQKIPLPHNSMFILGLPTNQLWTHSINQDKRLPREKSPEELAFNGERISLTFRHIGTFLSKDEKKIYGQGAVAKTKETAGDVIVGDEKRAEEMVFAFARENRLAKEFNWDEWYGKGFDVLHFKEQKRKIRVLKGGLDGGMGVRIAMEIVGWGDCIVEEVGADQVKGMEVGGGLKGGLPLLEDVDRDRTVVVGEEAVLMFLATAVEEGRKWLLPDMFTKRAEYARVLSGLMEVSRLRGAMEVFTAITGGVLVEHPLFQKVHEELGYWESWYQPRKESVSSDTEEGSRVNVVDCAIFPYLKRCRELGFLDVKEKDGAGLRYDALAKFVKRFEKEKVVKTIMKAMEA